MRAAIRACVFSLPLFASLAAAQPTLAWPAEGWFSATNLTQTEGPGTNDFYQDLSGAFWNPVTRRLWVNRNGPADTTSKFWALKQNAQGAWEVDTRNNLRAEWTGFGDLEALTQADLAADVVYLLVETEERIKSFNVSTYGSAAPIRNWNTRPFLPLSGGSGAEGLAFVSDAHLTAGGFVDAAGRPRVSQRGLGGLFFVGHQNGGGIHVFDLDAASDSFTFIGEYLTQYPEIADLHFDRSSGLLYALHGAGTNRIGVYSLASTPTAGTRRLQLLQQYLPPTGSTGQNMEGLSITPAADAVNGKRSLWITVDDGADRALLMFNNWPACEPPALAGLADFDGSGFIDSDDFIAFVADFELGCVALASPAPACTRSADFDYSGFVDSDDFIAFVSAFASPC